MNDQEKVKVFDLIKDAVITYLDEPDNFLEHIYLTCGPDDEFGVKVGDALCSEDDHIIHDILERFIGRIKDIKESDVINGN